MGESKGYLANMAIHSGADFGTGSPVAMKYISNGLKESIPVEQNDSIRCTRQRSVEDVAMGNISVAGPIVLEPNPVELDALLPYMGFSVNTGTWSLTEGLTDLYIMTDMQAKLHTFLTRVSSWTLTGEPGKKMRLTLNLVGKTLTIGNAGGFPSVSVDSTSRPYMFYDMGSGITINSIARLIDKFELNVDHKIEPTFMCGQEATDLEPMDLMIKLGIQTKFTSSETALQTDTRAGTARAGSVTFTNGGVSLGMTFAALLADTESPTVEGRGKIRLPLNYNVMKSGSTSALVITTDATP